jgi:hypothetical protein
VIYAIESNGRTIALTNDKNDALRFPDACIRWATPNEAATFRELAARHERKWLRDKIDAALWRVWRISFPPMHKHL